LTLATLYIGVQADWVIDLAHAAAQASFVPGGPS
jgi:hypothetical protein